MTWFDAFTILIAAGHRRDEILDYSYGEFKGYLTAAIKYQSQQLATNLRLNAAAACVPHSEKGFEAVEQIANSLTKQSS